MLFAKLQSEILRARNTREESLHRVLGAARGSVVFASTSIPGPNKYPEGTEALFHWLLATVRIKFGQVEWHAPVSYDPIGPYTVFSTPVLPGAVKYACVEIEELHAAARLIDLDVYTPDRNRIGRTDLGFPPRRCLVCMHSAADCMRLRRHDQESLNERVSLLLESLPDAPLRANAG